ALLICVAEHNTQKRKFSIGTAWGSRLSCFAISSNRLRLNRTAGHRPKCSAVFGLGLADDLLACFIVTLSSRSQLLEPRRSQVLTAKPLERFVIGTLDLSRGEIRIPHLLERSVCAGQSNWVIHLCSKRTRTLLSAT